MSLRPPTKEELDAIVDQTAANLEQLPMKALKTEAGNLSIKGRSKFTTLKDRPALARLIAEEKVKRGVAEQTAKADARADLTGTRKGAEIDEAQAKLDEMNSTLAKKGYYDRDTDYRSLELAEAGVTALMRKPLSWLQAR